MWQFKYVMYVCLGVLGLNVSGVWAQEKNYPTRPVTLIVAWPPGGSVDTVARLISEPLRVRLVQSEQSVQMPWQKRRLMVTHCWSRLVPIPSPLR